jgi:anti-anti-sigma factor
MASAYQHIHLEPEGDVAFVRFRQRKIEEPDLQALGSELIDLVEKQGCRKMALSLGPGTLECLYSVFLAKLVMIQRRLQDHNGALILCEVSPDVMTIFEACNLQTYFEFAPDRAAAVAALAKKGIP